MERAARLSLLVAVLAAGVLVVSPAASRVYETRASALARVFGAGASFEPHTVFLTPAQVESLRARARAPFDAARVTFWIATRSDTLLGRAFLDTYTVRTMPATLLVAVGPDDSVRAVEILAFHEPEDYMPPRRWLDRLHGRTLSSRLRPGDALDVITGATISARTTAESVRRCLALAQIVGGGR